MERADPGARGARPGQAGGAAVGALCLVAAALLVTVGARRLGDRADERYRCQGDAVFSIGTGQGGRCGG
ncbi:MAG TPA: hypothetical protein VKZ63_12580, partial [Kofleriaceae bacterium]|nr:hypothetical protein [Kofleriaceae bacterium]